MSREGLGVWEEGQSKKGSEVGVEGWVREG